MIEYVAMGLLVCWIVLIIINTVLKIKLYQMSFKKRAKERQLAKNKQRINRKKLYNKWRI